MCGFCLKRHGSYELGGQPIVMKDHKATLLDGTIAGSSISLLDAPPRRKAGHSGVIVRRGVAQGDRAGLGHLADEFRRALLFAACISIPPSSGPPTGCSARS